MITLRSCEVVVCYSILKRLHGIVLGQFNQQVVRAAVTYSKADFVREMSRVGGVVRCTEGYIRREAQGLHMGHVVYTGGTGQGYEPVMMGYSGGSCISSGSTIGLPPLLRKVTTCARLKLISIHNKIHTLLLVRSYSRYTNDTICSSSEPRFSPFWPAVEQKSTTRCEPDMPWVIMVCDGPWGVFSRRLFSGFLNWDPHYTHWHLTQVTTQCFQVFLSGGECHYSGSACRLRVVVKVVWPCALFSWVYHHHVHLQRRRGSPPPYPSSCVSARTHSPPIGPTTWPPLIDKVCAACTLTQVVCTHTYTYVASTPPPPGLSTLNEMSPQIRLVYDVAGHGIRPLSLQNVQVCRVPMPTLIATFTSRSPELGKTENCRAVTAVLTVRRRYLLIQKLTDFQYDKNKHSLVIKRLWNKRKHISCKQTTWRPILS